MLEINTDSGISLLSVSVSIHRLLLFITSEPFGDINTNSGGGQNHLSQLKTT